MIRVRVLGLVGLLVALSGCAPQVEFDPVAVALGPSGAPEIIYTSCAPVAVRVVEVVAVVDNWGDGTPRVWQVSFPRGSKRTSFTIGTTPEGAVENVRRRPVGDNADLAARIVLDGNVGVYQGFTMSQLQPGRVVFRDRSMTDAEFRRASACG